MIQGENNVCNKTFPRCIYLRAWLRLLTMGLASSANAQCALNSPSGKIKHVVYIEFDNVHFTRDNPNVPSDLEQMPNLLNFLTQKVLSTRVTTPYLSPTRQMTY